VVAVVHIQEAQQEVQIVVVQEVVVQTVVVVQVYLVRETMVDQEIQLMVEVAVVPEV